MNGSTPNQRKSFIFLLYLTDVPSSPQNPKELFNLRHSQARNVVERIFGVLKRRFRMLHSPPEYNMDIQALIPPALAALHNFIRQYDPEDIQTSDDDDDDDDDDNDDNDNDSDKLPDFQRPISDSVGELGMGTVTSRESARANERRDRIAGEMWEQYQRYLESYDE
jgi:hypothetical protein